jgi:ribose transport system substrate-binding protein
LIISQVEEKTMISKVLKTTAAAAFGLASVFGTANASEAPEGGTVAAVENTKGPVKIAFLSFQNNPFWTPVTEGAKAANEYLKNFDAAVDFVDLGNELSAEAVVAGIEGALAKQYDGIVVVPIFDGTARIINEATESGVPVFNIVAEGAAPVRASRLHRTGRDLGR